MSPFSGPDVNANRTASDGAPRRRPAAHLRRAAVAVAALVMLAMGLAPEARAQARAPAVPDTGRVVDGVRVTDEGIEIYESGGVRHIDVAKPPGESNDDDRVRISIGDSKDIVSINGPVVVVDSDETGIVRVFADAFVPAGREVDGDVVAVFGSVRVDGAVSGSVVSVLGSVRLGPGATVSGDAVAVGGELDLERGATVHGESVSVGFTPFSWGIPTLGFLLLSIGSSMLITLFFAWLLFLVMDRRMRRAALTVTRRTGSSLVVGLISPPLVIITIGLLFITVIGIPGAFLLPVLYGVVLFAGQVAASYVLGCKLMRREVGQGGVMLPLLIGSLFVALFFVVGAMLAVYPGWTRSAALFFCLAGMLLLIVLAIVGSGAILVSRIGSRPDDALREGGPADPAPKPAPAPAPFPSATS
jgi:hypothetical protein